MNSIPGISPRRILIITRNLPPLVGGMERLNWHMAEELAINAEVRIVAPSGTAGMAPSNVRIQEVALNPLTRFLLSAQWQAYRIARTWKPDVILAGSGLTAPVAWVSARFCGAESAAYVHGLDIATRHPLYRALWLPALRRMDRVIANSRATRQLALDAGIENSRIAIVHPGTDLAQDPPGPAAVEQIRSDQTQGEGPVLLSVGRLTRRKGLREFVTDVLPQIVSARPGAMLLIVGDAPTDALHAESQTQESIQAAADAAGVGANIRFLGVITDRRRLAALYRSADVHVFPVQHIPGDPEGFGMVAIEAAAEGLPTVAYSTNGVVDAVSEGESGLLVPPGDSAGFARAVLELLDNPPSPSMVSKHAEKFSWAHFGEGLRAALDNAHLSH